ncbi:MAG: glycine dehydrogenase (aminomethyl-transferring) [Acidobacteria bacterium]|nr:MAG: glycine dehydrogenase (aminomethyl-transferring) [Acidobacteriota bacterium]REK00839.1 MAG: glycine dehydrogenase (aminomethyl-transferring) [Acidobacteriota bacterium]
MSDATLSTTGPEVQTPRPHGGADASSGDDRAASSTSLTSATAVTAFHRRHNGPGPEDVERMLDRLGLDDLEQLVQATVPPDIRVEKPLRLGRGVDHGLGEHEALERLRRISGANLVRRSLLGMGYHASVTPPCIQRNVLENPGWYTAYTPYQAEIAQGRLEALLNFQQMVLDLTGLEIANASLLDEATAAAEAMGLAFAAARQKKNRFLVAETVHPQNLEVVRTRAEPLGIEVVSFDPAGDPSALDWSDVFGVALQYPDTLGEVRDPGGMIAEARAHEALSIVIADPLALVLLRSPGELGADLAVGSTQRFGLPMGFGGPHAAYMATREEFKRLLPGRVVGVSRDRQGRPALRLALQTREQHIRRDKATSNICTAQVLPAVLASMYAVYHGPRGLRHIAETVHRHAALFAAELRQRGAAVVSERFFDTVLVEVSERDRLLHRAAEAGFNLRAVGEHRVAVAFDERSDLEEVGLLTRIFTGLEEEAAGSDLAAHGGTDAVSSPLAAEQRRQDAILTHPVFSRYRSETDLMRYLHRLQSRDLSLTTSMIPLGSCTMKLNAAAEMMPITWPGFADLHPFAPRDQSAGYDELCEDLEEWLCEITGFSAMSLQPNAGSQGEYAGLLVIRRYHQERGEGHRDVCLIPTSAHGTNPASAVMAGLRVVAVRCDDQGNIDLEDLAAKAEEHRDRLAALMVTYPSTHGVFETEIRRICELVHEAGGQVYLDGANMNAQVGLCRPGDYGADVCHLNLHKTFCIPHGGGGPGMGPIGVMPHLAPHLPAHRTTRRGGEQSVGAVSAAPVGSGTILPISWAYIAMMGSAGLTEASRLAILNANYLAKRLEEHYPILYRGRSGFVAHECILDLRPLKKAGIEVEDIAKRLMDYGYHAPTVSWPVAGTVMVEPTESESLAELDRFCEAMIAIREEARAVERGEIGLESSPLRRAPHTAEDVTADRWELPYSRQTAAFPAPWLREHKYWPPVARIDNVYGDRNLVCSCVGMDEFVAED